MRTSTSTIITDLAATADAKRLCITCPDGSLHRNLGRLVSTGELVSPWRGMFAVTEQWNNLKPLEQYRRVVRTLSKRYPSWTFSHFTAAIMHGLEMSYRNLKPLHLAVGPDCRTKSTHKITRHVIGDEEFVLADGVRVTPLKRTALDCLIDLDFRRGLAIADSALRVGGMKRAELIAYIKSRTDVPGWESALDAAAWADPLAANGGESVARAVMIEQGFALPKLQVAIPNVIEGGEMYYADFLWELADGSRVAGELDGLEKYYDPTMTGGRSVARVMSDERRRESRLGAAGLKVVRFSFAEVEDVTKFSQLLSAYGIPRGPARRDGKLD